MAKKKTTAVRKAAKTPTVKVLKAEVSTLTREETSYKHAEATARTAASRKHDAAEVSSIGKKITSLKHTIASKSSRKTGLALVPGDVECCAAQALAASLRLALGAAVHDEDVLALYWRTADDPEEGASILATLEAAREYGLSGVRPSSFAPAPLGLFRDAQQRGQRFIEAGDIAASGAEALHQTATGLGLPGRPDIPHFAALAPAEDRQPDVEFGCCGDVLGTHGLILRLDLPEGPHAVTVAPDGAWWSWGEPYAPADFAAAVVTEAWAVSWS
jgi:hypothetical protein